MDEDDFGISMALPHLEKENVEALKKSLQELGVPDEIALKDITVDDLIKTGLLKEKAAIILINEWNGGEFLNTYSES